MGYPYFTFYSDPLSMGLYFLAILIMLLSVGAQVKVKSTFYQYAQVMNRSGLTGAMAARRVLEANGVQNVQILSVAGELTDHYDPRANVIRLSEPVYGSATVSAVGVAAHEAGHAVQYAKGYAPIRVRAAILPVAQLASGAAIPLALLGFVLSMLSLVYLGIALFAAVTLFQLVTLPVELNASRRAIAAIGEGGLLDEKEKDGAKKVLRAAAMTYVAALASSLVQLLRLLVMANNSRRR